MKRNFQVPFFALLAAIPLMVAAEDCEGEIFALPEYTEPDSDVPIQSFQHDDVEFGVDLYSEMGQGMFEIRSHIAGLPDGSSLLAFNRPDPFGVMDFPYNKFISAVQWPLGPASTVSLGYIDPESQEEVFVRGSEQSLRIDERVRVVKVKFWNTRDEATGEASHVQEAEARMLVDNPMLAPFRSFYEGYPESFLDSGDFKVWGTVDDVYNQCPVESRVNFRFESLGTVDVPKGCATPPGRAVLGFDNGVFKSLMCDAVFFGGTVHEGDETYDFEPLELIEDRGERTTLHVVFVKDIPIVPGVQLLGAAKGRTVVVSVSFMHLSRDKFVATLAHEIGHVLELYKGDLPEAVDGHVSQNSEQCSLQADDIDNHLMCGNVIGLGLDDLTCATAYRHVNQGLSRVVEDRGLMSPSNFNIADEAAGKK